MRTLCFLMTLLFANMVCADTSYLTTKIKRVQVNADSEFGGCLVRPSDQISTSLNCPDAWISLDCAGTLGGTKSAGQRRLDQVSLAILLQKKVTLRVTDDQKINGWCFADRVAVTH